MGLHVNLMMDEEFRKEALELIREQIRPVIREELQKISTEELVKAELKKVMADMPERVAGRLRTDVEYHLRHDREFQNAVVQRAADSLKTHLAKLNTNEIESIVKNVIRQKLGGI